MNVPRMPRLARALLLACLAAAPLASARAAEPAPAVDPRPLDPAIWSRKAISYSGYREGQSPASGVHPSRDEIFQDLTLLREAGFGLIRLYGAQVHGRAVVETIAERGLDIRVQLGAYVAHSMEKNGEANRRELDAAIELANAHPDIVAAVSVGNEVLVSWSFVPVPPAELMGHLAEVRARVRQPITVNDNWEPYAAAPGSAIAAVWGLIDYASIHTYAYWDAGFELWDFRRLDTPEPQRARAMMDSAAAYARKNFASVRAALDAAGRRIPIVVGETGWQSRPSAYLNEAKVKDFARHQGHPANQAMYFADMMAWAYGKDGYAPGDGFERPAAMFYFSAFDEPWKNADDNWGLWDAARVRKVATGDAVFFRAPAE